MQNKSLSIITPKKGIILLFIGFIVLYLAPGIYGHSPWKQDENYSFGIIQTMYETGNWLVPTNAGEPFMEKPPLYYWVATITSHLFSGFMPLYDAARSASFLFSIINFSFFILLARRFFQSHDFTDLRIWTALALYLCAPGVLRHSHDMFTDVALMAGATMGLYGLLGLIQKQKILTSTIWLATGTIITLLSKGVFVPGVLWISLCLAPLFLPQCRTKQFFYTSLIAGVFALVFILPWPILLYLHHPDLFLVWFWENNIGRFFGFSVEKLGAKANLTRIPAAVTFFALPAGLLATAYFIRHPIKRLLSSHEYLMTIFPLLGIIFLQASASGRALYLLPFIAPMAILGVQTLQAIPAKILRGFSRFSAVFWSLLIIFLWISYGIALCGDQQTALAFFSRWLPMNYQIQFSTVTFISALVITLVWFFRHKIIPLTTSPSFNAMKNWLLGITAVWGIILTLFIGWIDYAKGFGSVFIDLKYHLAEQYRADDCMASDNIGESEAPMLYYYTGIMHQRQDSFKKPTQCRWLIVLSKEVNPAPQGMTLFWSNHRPDQYRENVVVYKTTE